MDWNKVWLWLTIFLVAGDLSLAFGPQDLEGGQNRDWLLESQLLNSVPRIGRRSFSPISKFRGEGFRFFGGDMPRGIGFNDVNRNWRGPYGRTTIGGGPHGAGSEPADKDDVTSGGVGGAKEEVRDKRTEPDNNFAIPRLLSLGDDDYWNEILNGARKNVLEKLSKLNLNENEDALGGGGGGEADPVDDLDQIPGSSPPLTRYFSRYPLDLKAPAAEKGLKPQLSRAEILNKMNGFRGFARNNLKK